MSAAKHTQGPWHVDGRDVCAWEGKIETTICECYAHASAGRNVAEHNANLIAAAPDLLAALEGMLDPLHICGMDCDPNKTCPRGDAARAALKKARGE